LSSGGSSFKKIMGHSRKQDIAAVPPVDSLERIHEFFKGAMWEFWGIEVRSRGNVLVENLGYEVLYKLKQMLLTDCNNSGGMSDSFMASF